MIHVVRNFASFRVNRLARFSVGNPPFQALPIGLYSAIKLVSQAFFGVIQGILGIGDTCRHSS